MMYVSPKFNIDFNDTTGSGDELDLTCRLYGTLGGLDWNLQA
jgi:hypothetical protein